MKILFAAPVKNCELNLQKNLNFINKLIIKNKFETVSVFIFEGDSTDKTKKILKNIQYKNYRIFHEDGLQRTIPNRIKRISYCREFLLNKVKESKIKFDFYIPIDLDVDLFSKINVDEFYELIENLNRDSNADVYFPNSTPYYYDISALRAKGWINKDPWEKYYKITKYIQIGKFFVRYLFIYKNQISLSSNLPQIRVDSAFGGIGIYKLKNFEIINLNYTYQNGIGSDHVNFNKFFKTKFIIPQWQISAPHEHIEFKLLNLKNKVKYVIKDILYDFKNFIYNFRKL